MGLQTDVIDLSPQTSGMYFVTITSGTSSYTAKIVKQ